MSTKEEPTSADGEVYRPAWQGSRAWISYGLPFPEACAKHIANTFKASKVYIIASGSLSRNTNHVKRLQEKLGQSVVGTRYGMKPHTLWSELVEVTNEAKELKADLLITLGAGSLTDAAKIISLVSTVRPYNAGRLQMLTITRQLPTTLTPLMIYKVSTMPHSKTVVLKLQLFRSFVFRPRYPEANTTTEAADPTIATIGSTASPDPSKDQLW